MKRLDEELIHFFVKNRENLETEESTYIFLEENFPLVSVLNLLSKDLMKVSGIADLIKLSSNKKLQVLLNRVSDEHLNLLDEFYFKKKRFVKDVFYDLLDLHKLEEEAMKKKLFSTNKTKISKEFGVDIKTFNKWLELLFNDRFKGVRKIYFDEYVEIFSALFLAKDEELDLIEYINVYKRRLTEGMRFRKKDIVKYTNEDSPLDISTLLKIQKEQLGSNEFYSFTDIYPYSITKLLVEELGDEIDF